jgi:hypothetical protein
MSGKIDYINDLKQKNLFQKGIEMGIVNKNWIYWIEVYQTYQDELIKGGKKSDIIYNVSQKCNLSEPRIYQVLSFFQ